jgi:hypothetical protein
MSRKSRTIELFLDKEKKLNQTKIELYSEEKMLDASKHASKEYEIQNKTSITTTEIIEKDINQKPVINLDTIENMLKKISNSNTAKRSDFVDNIRLMLTYDVLLNTEEYKIWLQNLNEEKRLNLKEIIIVHSKTQTHMLITWDKRFRSRSQKILDYNGNHPLVRYIAKPAELEIIHNYIKLVDINNT